MAIESLIIGGVLSWFGFDKKALEVLQPFVDFPLTTSHYYVGLFILGVILSVIEYIFRRR